MPAGIHVHDGIVPTIRIEIKPAYGFGIKIFYGIGIQESAGFGVVVSTLEIVKTGLGIEVVTAVSVRISVTDMRVTVFTDIVFGNDIAASVQNLTVAPGIVLIFYHKIAFSS